MTTGTPQQIVVGPVALRRCALDKGHSRTLGWVTGSIPDRHFGDTPVALPVAGGQNLPVTVERCDQCGFDGEDWDDASAIGAVVGLPARWVEAVSGLTSNDSHRRLVADMWSVAEYADHVREVLFSMRFLLDTAVAQPGADLGKAPEPRFEREPRFIEVDSALAGIDREATSLRDRLSELPPSGWNSVVIVDGNEVDPHWIVRHAVHDATHHLLDVERLRGDL